MIAYFFFRILIFLFSLIPFWLLYRISDFTYLIVYKIVGYRKKVVKANLKNAFPDKTAQELLAIEKKFYHHLFDILVESIKGFSMSEATFLKRQKMLTPLGQEMLNKHSSILILGGHYGNWEWGGISGSSHFDADVVILYAPLKNKKIDEHLKKSRELHKTYFWAGPLAPRAFKKYKEDKAVFVLIADQSPSNPKRAHWLTFLNQETGFLRGPSSYAINYNIPLLYIDIQRIKRGYYTMELEILTENPSALSPEAITKLYAQKLEEKIKKRPELWLWSHRRWKHKKE